MPEAGQEQWPEPREAREHFLERCVAGLTAGGMSRDKADEVCSAKWRDARKEAAMPLRKPKTGESQSEFMRYCMHELATESETERPQEQMVAICLSAWREERGGSPPSKFDVTQMLA